MRLVNIRLVLTLIVIAAATNAAMAAPKFPSILAISPTTVAAGTASFTLTVSGANFNGSDAVMWNGTKLATTLLNSMQATASIPSAAVASAGTAQIAMWDSRTGKIYNSLTFTITQGSATPSPTISVSITPNNSTTTTNGTIQFTASVTGTTNTAVTWSVASGGGTVSSAGLYTASSTTGTASVVAASVVAPASALANVTITAPTTMLVSASPTSVSFGSVLVGTSTTKAVTISNTGNSAVTVSSASLTGTGFNLSGLSFPFTLAASASQSANVIFAPSSSGTASGSLSFVSNATNSPATVGLSGSGTAAVQHTATLSWQPGSPSPAGYNVYRSTISGGSYSRLNSTLEPTVNYSDSTVASGQTYYYVVTEVSSSGMESGYSSQVSAVIPTP